MRLAALLVPIIDFYILLIIGYVLLGWLVGSIILAVKLFKWE